MSGPFEDLNPVGISPEDRVNAMRGYKATLNNPRVSQEAKQHARDMLENQLMGDEPSKDIHDLSNPTKEKNRVQGGYKAATKNPRVSEAAKEYSQERLAQMSTMPQPEE
ncbi:hypothetical protein VTN31DRAFT_701 [Thermomyces dupontii]|uniref:uncharacterized protein n=1 Tax=Talaromyces thermophilus TaxID=28565 RepID=UPI003743C26D